MEFALVIWILFGVVTAVVATNKGKNGCAWFALGVLLGPFGLILSLVTPRDQTAVEQKAVSSGEMRKCPYCAELIKAEAIKCRFCGSDLPTDPPKEDGHVQASQSTTTCGSCGAQVDLTHTFCIVCGKPLTAAAVPAPNNSEAGAGTWHLILDRRAAEERGEVLLTALRSLSLDPALRAVNEREVKIASGATLQQVNALMIRLHEVGVISRKQRD